MSAKEQFNVALHSEQPLWRLREVVQGLLVQGHERDAIAADLESFRSLLQESGRDEDEDIVLEVIDFLAGWCSPHMRL